MHTLPTSTYFSHPAVVRPKNRRNYFLQFFILFYFFNAFLLFLFIYIFFFVDSYRGYRDFRRTRDLTLERAFGHEVVLARPSRRWSRSMVFPLSDRVEPSVVRCYVLRSLKTKNEKKNDKSMSICLSYAQSLLFIYKSIFNTKSCIVNIKIIRSSNSSIDYLKIKKFTFSIFRNILDTVIIKISKQVISHWTKASSTRKPKNK